MQTGAPALRRADKKKNKEKNNNNNNTFAASEVVDADNLPQIIRISILLLYRARIIIESVEKMTAADTRMLGVARSMDLIMYVLYSDDQLFVRNMVAQVAREVSAAQTCPELLELLEHHHESPQLYRSLFFLLLDFYPKFRYWVLQDNSLGLQPVCPHKALRFLKELRAELVPQFLINETLRFDDFERTLKIEYVRS